MVYLSPAYQCDLYGISEPCTVQQGSPSDVALEDYVTEGVQKSSNRGWSSIPLAKRRISWQCTLGK